MKKILFFILVCVAQLGFAQEILLTKDSLKNGLKINWRYSSKDTAGIANIAFNDSKLPLVTSRLRSPYFNKNKYEGKGWFRFKFKADSSIIKIPLAFALNLRGATEVYLDGKLIKKYGKIGGLKDTEYYNPKGVPEIINLQDTGVHLVVLKLLEYKAEYENYDGFEFKIGIADDLINNKIENNTAFTFIVIFLSVLFLTLGILHLFFFLFYRNNISNLFFSLFMLGLSAVLGIFFVSFLSNDPKQTEMFGEIIFYLIPAISLFFTAFIHHIFHEKTKIWLILFSVLTGINYITLFSNKSDFEIVFAILLFGIIIHGLIRILISIIKKQKGSWIIGTGIIFSILIFLFIVSISFSGGININGGELLGKLLLSVLSLSVVSIPLSMSVYQAWYFANLNTDLSRQLTQVKILSEKTIEQEVEKKQILENQKAELEIKVEERTFQLKEEKKKSDDLLLNILPEEVAEELKQKGSAEAQLIEEVTVLFTDFKGFTTMAEQLSPKELIYDIHECFSAFDRIMEKYGIEKIKTIGDSYMAAGGLPTPNKTHPQDVVNAALEISAFIEEGKALKIAKGLPYFEIRIGVHTGPVVAGIVGIKKFAYDIWGDTVNTASRMESSGEVGKVNISEITYELVKNTYKCNYRGEIEAKGKGKIKMYFVERDF